MPINQKELSISSLFKLKLLGMLPLNQKRKVIINFKIYFALSFPKHTFEILNYFCYSIFVFKKKSSFSVPIIII